MNKEFVLFNDIQYNNKITNQIYKRVRKRLKNKSK